jgi:hypothetical protein
MKPTPFNFNSDHFETLIYSAYYAPRGRQRLYMLAGELSNRYIYPNDLLIGIIGAEGSGKSTLIKGLFPGLELTNDDEGVNLRPMPPSFSGSERKFWLPVLMFSVPNLTKSNLW